ncbi:hypothetical protein AB0H73_05060 [Streptomyces olivoreticuli]
MPNPRPLLLRGGPVGLAVLLALRAAGAGYIAVSQPAGARAEPAEQFGADRVLDPMSLLLGEGSYTAGNAYGESVCPAVIAALGHGSLRPEKMITKWVALDDAVKEAFGALLDPAGAAHQVKVLVHP